MQTPIGAQIWSLRSLIQDNANKVLSELASAGSTYIEPAGLDTQTNSIQGIALPALKEIADSLGLKIPSLHFAVIDNDIEKVCQSAIYLGAKYVVIPSLPNASDFSLDDYKAAAYQMNEIGVELQKCGLKLAYHNHAHELEPIGGTIPFDVLLKETDPALVAIQADLGWMVHRGFDPVDFFRKYPGRFPLWHLRDIDAKTLETVAIGKGMVNFQSIFQGKEITGLEYAFVEMASSMEQPFDNMLDSFKAIHRWDFV